MYNSYRYYNYAVVWRQQFIVQILQLCFCSETTILSLDTTIMLLFGYNDTLFSYYNVAVVWIQQYFVHLLQLCCLVNNTLFSYNNNFFNYNNTLFSYYFFAVLIQIFVQG